MNDRASQGTVGRRLHLTLNYRPIGLVRATVTELLDDYLTIDTGCITLATHSEVDVGFMSSDRRFQRFRATVIGSSDDRTLLQIRENPGHSYAELHNATQ